MANTHKRHKKITYVFFIKPKADKIKSINDAKIPIVPIEISDARTTTTADVITLIFSK
jgi:hypothetical protein